MQHIQRLSERVFSAHKFREVHIADTRTRYNAQHCGLLMSNYHRRQHVHNTFSYVYSALRAERKRESVHFVCVFECSFVFECLALLCVPS